MHNYCYTKYIYIRTQVMTPEQHAYQKQYREANKERISEYNRKYREANPEKFRECFRRWADKPESKNKLAQYKKAQYERTKRTDFDRIAKNKIHCYKMSDIKYARPFILGNSPDGLPNYITLEWVKAELIKCANHCYHCGKQLKLTHYERCDPDQFSVDRIFNDMAHEPLNCVISCYKCNLTHKSADIY